MTVGRALQCCTGRGRVGQAWGRARPPAPTPALSVASLQTRISVGSAGDAGCQDSLGPCPVEFMSVGAIVTAQHAQGCTGEAEAEGSRARMGQTQGVARTQGKPLG